MIALKQKQLFEEVDILPIDLKTKLVDRLLSSINPMDKEIDNLWIKEAKSRKEEIKEENLNLINGEEVFKKIQKKFNS